MVNGRELLTTTQSPQNSPERDSAALLSEETEESSLAVSERATPNSASDATPSPTKTPLLVLTINNNAAGTTSGGAASPTSSTSSRLIDSRQAADVAVAEEVSPPSPTSPTETRLPFRPVKNPSELDKKVFCVNHLPIV